MIYQVGKYCVTLLGDEVAVTDMDQPLYEDQSKWKVPPTIVAGLGKLMAGGKGAVTLSRFDDEMEVIHFIKKGDRYGYGYALNLDVPYFSEWGASGIVR